MSPDPPGPAAAGGAFLEVADLRAAYGAVKVLHGVDLTVREGQVCAVLGANGAGKTTLLRALSGGVRARGTATLQGVSLVGRSPEAVARLGVAHVPEGRGTFGTLTVEENLRLGGFTRSRAQVEADLPRVQGWFPVLRDRARQLAGSLSGGEQQMLALGRALMLRPRLLLLDEPSLGLAPLVTRELFTILRTIQEEEGTTVVLVEQNARLALEVAHTAHVLETGRVVTSGPADRVRADDHVARAYLGYDVTGAP
jgi:branched-chain amino acid transport system ATP-binding protein